MGTVTSIHADVVEEHVARATVLYRWRSATIRSRAAGLRELAHLDARLRAHLDALVAVGDVAEAFLDGNSSLGPAGAFVRTVVAARRDGRDGLERMVTKHPAPEHEPSLVAALGWLPPQLVSPTLEDWLGYDGPRWRALALAALVAHRLDPRGAVVRGLEYDDDPRVRSEAVRACGVFGYRSLAPALRRLHDSGSGDLRFLCARALLHLRQPDGPAMLWRCACEAGPWSELAAELALRDATAPDARRWLEQSRPRPHLARVMLTAAAATGRPTHAPYLLDVLEDPDLGALAAYGLQCMFGLDLEARGLALDRRDGPDPDLPFPDAAAVRRWWDSARSRFDPNGRWLRGHPFDVHAMRYALWHGPQRLRGLAAHDLHRLLGGDRVPFEVDAPAWRQRRRMATAMRLRSSST